MNNTENKIYELAQLASIPAPIRVALTYSEQCRQYRRSVLLSQSMGEGFGESEEELSRIEPELLPKEEACLSQALGLLGKYFDVTVKQLESDAAAPAGESKGQVISLEEFLGMVSENGREEKKGPGSPEESTEEKAEGESEPEGLGGDDDPPASPSSD